LSGPLDKPTSSVCSNVSGPSNEGLIKFAVQEELNKKTVEERDIKNHKQNVIIYRVPKKKCDKWQQEENMMPCLLKIFRWSVHCGIGRWRY